MQGDYNGLIFDVDGTLFDIREYIPVFRGLLSDAIYNVNGMEIDLTADDAYKPLALPLEESDKFLKERWGIRDPKEFWERVGEIDMQKRIEMIEDLKMFPDVEVLRDLKDYFSLGILSNTPERIVRMQIDHYGIGDIFDHMVCSPYKTMLSKPGTKGMELLLRMMGLEMGDVVYFGDSDVDQKLCGNADIPFVKVERGHNHLYDFSGDHYTINGFHEIGSVLNEMSVRQEGCLSQKV